MPTQKIVNGEVVYELSLIEFQTGLFQLAGENGSEFNRLMQEFKSTILDEIVKTTNAKGKSKKQIAFDRIKRRESRRHYHKLRRNLKNANIIKPKDTAAHHLVSWRSEHAVIAREILGKFGIDVDSEHNGTYLPRFRKHVPHPSMPDAYAHSVVHTKAYYVNITQLLVGQAKIPNTSKDDIIDVLQEIAQELKNGTFPIFNHQTVGR